MKYLFLPILMVLALGRLSAQTAVEPTATPEDKTTKITWYSIEEAYALNAKEPKKIFIDVYTNWCGWCKRMDATTFIDPAVVQYINENYYAVKLNAETSKEITLGDQKFVNPNPGGKRSTHQLAASLLGGQMSYPSYVFLNEKTEKLTVVKGYLKVPDFQPIIHFFGSNAYLTEEWEEYQKKYSGM